MSDIYRSIENLIKENVIKVDFYLIVLKDVNYTQKQSFMQFIIKMHQKQRKPCRKKSLKSFESIAKSEHPDAVLENIGSFNVTLLCDRDFSKDYQKYTSNVGTQSTEPGHALTAPHKITG